MTTIHSEGASRLEKWIHRKFHELEERVDLDADTVSEIIEEWESTDFDKLLLLIDKHGSKVMQVIRMWEQARIEDQRRNTHAG